MKPADARDRLEERLLSLLYGELTEGEAAAVRAELEADPKAAARFAEWQSLHAQFQSLPEPEPDPQVHYDILREARKAVMVETAPRGFWGWLERLSATPALAGIGLLAAAAGLVAIFNTMETEQADLAPAPAANQATPAPVAPPASAVQGLPGGAAPSLAEATTLGAEGGADVAADDPAEAAKPVTAAVEPPADVPAFEPAAPEAEKSEGRRARGPLEQKAAPAKGSAADGLLADLDAAQPGDAPMARRPAPKAKPQASTRNKRKASKLAMKGDLEDAFGAVDKKEAPATQAPAPDPAPPAAQAEAEPAQRYAPPPPPAAPAPQADGDGLDRVEAEERAANAEVLGGAEMARSDDGAAVAAAVAPQREPAPAEVPTAEDEGGDLADDRAVEADLTESLAAKKRGEAKDDRGADAPAQAATPARRASATAGGGGAAAADPLASARAARSAGRLREAVAAYEDVIRSQRRGPTLEQAWFEAAQTYERLGDRIRAVQLYRLVASAGGANAPAALARINALTPPGTGNASPNPFPIAAPMEAVEDAPSSIRK